MRRLKPEKLHVSYLSGTSLDGPVIPRRYTLTHSDFTGDLYLTIGKEYDQGRLSHWYTRLMRDEVIAEWETEHDDPVLAVYCHISGGLVFGSAKLRDKIFRHELPLVLEALRFGDSGLFDAHPDLDSAPIVVVFHAKELLYNVRERWGTPAEYL